MKSNAYIMKGTGLVHTKSILEQSSAVGENEYELPSSNQLLELCKREKQF